MHHCLVAGLSLAIERLRRDHADTLLGAAQGQVEAGLLEVRLGECERPLAVLVRQDAVVHGEVAPGVEHGKVVDRRARDRVLLHLTLAEAVVREGEHVPPVDDVEVEVVDLGVVGALLEDDEVDRPIDQGREVGRGHDDAVVEDGEVLGEAGLEEEEAGRTGTAARELHDLVARIDVVRQDRLQGPVAGVVVARLVRGPRAHAAQPWLGAAGAGGRREGERTQQYAPHPKHRSLSGWRLYSGMSADWSAWKLKTCVNASGSTLLGQMVKYHEILFIWGRII